MLNVWISIGLLDKKVSLDQLVQVIKAKHIQYQKNIERNRRKTKVRYQLL